MIFTGTVSASIIILLTNPYSDRKERNIVVIFKGKILLFFEGEFKMCRFSLDEATTRSQSLRLFFFKYFLVRYFRYLGKKEKDVTVGWQEKPSTIL
jgi:hypothetical protein